MGGKDLSVCFSTPSSMIVHLRTHDMHDYFRFSLCLLQRKYLSVKLCFTSATKQTSSEPQSLRISEGVLTTYSDHRHARSIWIQDVTRAPKSQFRVAESAEKHCK